MCGQATRSGIVEVLKGHVFPQWKKRFISIIGAQLVIFPGDAKIKADVFSLAGAQILEHTPTNNRLIIKVVPNGCKTPAAHAAAPLQEHGAEALSKSSIESTSATIAAPWSVAGCSTAQNNAESNFYNSHDSVHSTIEKETSSAVLFFGFEDSWERDLWSDWLHEVSTIVSSLKFGLINVYYCAELIVCRYIISNFLHSLVDELNAVTEK